MATPPKKRKTPADYIQRREKQAGQLIERGVSPKQARQQAGEAVRQEEQAKFDATPEGVAEKKLQQLVVENQANKIIQDRIFGKQPQQGVIPPAPLPTIAQEQLTAATPAPQAQGTEPIPTETPSPIELTREEIIQRGAAKGATGIAFPSVPATAIRVGESIAPTAADIFDAVTSAFNARKSAQVITAESSFNDAMRLISSDIQAVKAGAKSKEEARIGFEKAQAALNRLQRTNKGLGKANLRYWLGGGKEVEAEVIVFQELMQNLRAELDAAALAAAQQQAINSFGVGNGGA